VSILTHAGETSGCTTPVALRGKHLGRAPDPCPLGTRARRSAYLPACTNTEGRPKGPGAPLQAPRDRLLYCEQANDGLLALQEVVTEDRERPPAASLGEDGDDD